MSLASCVSTKWSGSTHTVNSLTACTSIRRLRGWSLASLNSVPSAPSPGPDYDLSLRIAELELENQRLRSIRDALIVRVESGTGHKPAPYAAFEHSVILAEQVRERTEALNLAMEELKASNKALSRAREEAETSRQRLSDAIESIADGFVLRSEEHTSELQSRPHLVCRLLLEKKK